VVAYFATVAGEVEGHPPLVVEDCAGLEVAPGMPGWEAMGGGVPTGGGPFGCCDDSHDWKSCWETTRTLARISEWPAPHSSVHSAG
jgi:hypothetical protein